MLGFLASSHLYGIDVSPDLISAVTDAVLEEVAAWPVRPLEPSAAGAGAPGCGATNRVEDPAIPRVSVLRIALGSSQGSPPMESETLSRHSGESQQLWGFGRCRKSGYSTR